jgi:hypothetical protein
MYIIKLSTEIFSNRRTFPLEWHEYKAKLWRTMGVSVVDNPHHSHGTYMEGKSERTSGSVHSSRLTSRHSYNKTKAMRRSAVFLS